MKIRVLVIGAPPGSNGGIGVLMDNLQATSSERTELKFLDSGVGSGWRRFSFIKSVIYMITRSEKYDLAHINIASKGSTLRKFFLCTILRFLKKPYFLHLHGGGYSAFYDRTPSFAKIVIRSLFRNAEKVIVLGATWRDFVIDTLQVPKSSVSLLWNGVPGPDQVPAKEDTLTTIVFSGRLSKEKGFHDLLSALGEVSTVAPWKCVVAGAEPDLDVASSLAPFGDRIEYVGWLARNELDVLLSSAHILVLPSHIEGLPLALLDGMAYGLAPIVTPVGAIPEVIQNRENGLLVPIGQPEALARAIEQLVDNKELCRKIGEKARLSWESDFDPVSMRVRLDAIYTNTINAETKGYL